jgi:hypothetical protein|eukprot:COSAG01_NODE_13772_length_1537_cov_6.831711_2_plen_83_part_00
MEREKLEPRFSATRKQPEKAAKKVDTRRTTKDVEVFKQVFMKLWMTGRVLPDCTYILIHCCLRVVSWQPQRIKSTLQTLLLQ